MACRTLTPEQQKMSPHKRYLIMRMGQEQELYWMALRDGDTKAAQRHKARAAEFREEARNCE